MKIDLIANTGIQFVNIPLNLESRDANSILVNFSERIIEDGENDIISLLEPYFWEDNQSWIAKDDVNPEAFNESLEIDPSKINPSYINKYLDEDDLYSVSSKESFEIWQQHWFPVPFFKVRPHSKEEPFFNGPKYWCRGIIEPITETDGFNTHILTLAFDTSTNKEKINNDEYNYLRDVDANDNGSERFKGVTQKEWSPAFFTSDRLNRWTWLINYANGRKQPREGMQLRHLAVYRVLLKALDHLGVFPDIGLLSGSHSIDVSLALDIGNARTCGILCENSRPYDNEQFNFSKARRLRIRNLTKPCQVTEDPFEMHVAFTNEKFGDVYGDTSDKSFNWPSLVRVGPEATILSSIFDDDDAQASMSSPKRYLWDKAPVKVPWIQIVKEQGLGHMAGVSINKPAMYGIAKFLSEDGRYVGPGLSQHSNYSRASIMLMAIYEILLQAISQVNSYEFRNDMGNSRFRRVLKDLILTCPTAMTEQEQIALRKSAVDAVELLKDSLGEEITLNEEGIQVLPELPNRYQDDETDMPWRFDEATCSQLSFLYGEIVHKFNSETDLFFKIKGKKRVFGEGNQLLQSLNVASIDVGGGTTDLMICNYQYKKGASIPVLTPRPLFWEGFNVAGDDIIKRVIQAVFIPQLFDKLLEYMRNCSPWSDGSKDQDELYRNRISECLNKLFGGSVANLSARQQTFRKQFANQVGSTFAIEALRYISSNDRRINCLTLNEVFEAHNRPESGLIDYLNNEIRKAIANEEFDLCEAVFTIDPLEVNEGIKDVMNDVLNQLSYLVSQFDCDLILLSGRPSGLPVIREILISNLAFSPDKVISLGNHRFGKWYPFADNRGFVNDPKSTVCVGAMVAYLNNTGKLPGMRFDLSGLKNLESTAKYIGVMDSSLERIPVENILLTITEDEGSFYFEGSAITLGMKQMKSEKWISSPLYVFDFKDEDAKIRLFANSDSFPFRVTISRGSSKGEWLKKEEVHVVDSNGMSLETRDFEFRLRTSAKNETHWRDSGAFIVQIG